MTNEELYYLPASELLRHIQAEKERLVKEKIIKKSKPLPPITEEEKPYELPDKWEWVRLSEIINVVFGTRIVKKTAKEGQYPVYGGGDITFYVNAYNRDTAIVVSRFGLSKKCTRYIKGKFFLNDSGLSLHTFNESFLRTLYIKVLMQSVQEQIYELSRGAAQRNLDMEKFNSLPIPFPPLYIQDQIVQKLEQLSETKDSLLSHAESQLSYTKKMREALLQEAIRGELVPQDENDEPASVLLEKIKAEKERLIKEKVIKKSKPLPPVTEEEKPYELPDKWEWVRLGDVVDFLGGYAFKSNTYVKKSKYQVIRIGNVKNFNLMLNSNPIYVSQHIARENDRYKLYKNDILVTMTGTLGKRDYFFTTLINDNDVEYRELYLNQRVGCLRTYYDVTAKLLNYFLKTNLILNQVFLTETGTANQGNIGANAIKELVIPLPPLSEQDRIVAKLDELMAHCDQLELKAEEMKQSTIKLFEANLKEAFIPE